MNNTIGVLLTNLGTPTAPTASAVRRYLAEFLWDKRVVDLPRPLWWLILNGFILPFRSFRSARNYQKIWQKEGSPLLVYSKKQAEKLQQLLNEKCASEVTPFHRKTKINKIKVVLAMRYGTPSIEQSLSELQASGITHLLVLPLYPQYSATTTGSTFDAVATALMQWRHIPEFRMISHYHDDSHYINAIAHSIKHHWATIGQSEHLLFSFHGIPKRFVTLGDPYAAQCHSTAHSVAATLGLNNSQYSIVFQSRFGKEEWLQPYCDKTLIAFAKQGKKSIDVICPGFAADCLETLEEMLIQNQQLFKKAGGERFHYIPALNDSSQHLEALTQLVLRNIQNWENPRG